jgi:diguanylate cyclase (GGDEF)-like protein/PAS domain S-box-containing protein
MEKDMKADASRSICRLCWSAAKRQQPPRRARPDENEARQLLLEWLDHSMARPKQGEVGDAQGVPETGEQGQEPLPWMAANHRQFAASVFTHAREGIMITDAANTIVAVNEAFTRITGYSREEAVGRQPLMLQSGWHPDCLSEMSLALVASGHWSGEVWKQRKNGEVYAEMLTVTALRNADGTVRNHVALLSDITPMKVREQQLERAAYYDGLTSLPNRLLLTDRLRQALAQNQRRARSLAVVYIDLDGFKVVNDLHGHDVGDALLVAVAQRMKKALREGDTLARIGGDEFVAVLVDLEWPDDGEPVLERLLQAAAEPVTAEHQILQVSSSIGVAIYPQDGNEVELLLRHADQAMYRAKQAGKNRCCLFEARQEAVVTSRRETRREKLEAVRRALDRREFVLYYQPKVNMKTGQVIGAEALIRWQNPARGLLLPAAFLPIIEDQALSIELGEWVIDTALTQMAEWRSAGLSVPVSVNVGACQLQQDDFAQRLFALLAVHPDVDPCCLELEVPETSTLGTLAHISRLMHACHAMRVRWALDGFGSGFYSFTSLRGLPVDLLKLDRSLVRDILNDPDGLAIVEAGVRLARAFGRQVIAEGVETVAHGELLLRLGCELAQGYGIACPMPAAELPRWVGSWQPAAAWTARHERLSYHDSAVLTAAGHQHGVPSFETWGHSLVCRGSGSPVMGGKISRP